MELKLPVAIHKFKNPINIRLDHIKENLYDILFKINYFYIIKMPLDILKIEVIYNVRNQRIF